MEAHLTTEARNADSANIDELPTEGVLRVINAADAEVAAAVAEEIPAITRAVDGDRRPAAERWADSSTWEPARRVAWACSMPQSARLLSTRRPNWYRVSSRAAIPR